VSEVRVTFKRPAKLGQDSALALEDYARVSSTFDAAIVMNAAHEVIGIQVATGKASLPDAVAQDIERFFDSLAADAADRLGWS
jgi:hypothetical protein